MNGEVAQVLQLVREQSISAAEGQRRLRELRSAAEPRPHPAAPTARPTAVIGMAAHFSSGRSYRDLWRMLKEGRSTIREVPRERWDADAFFDVDARTPGRTNSRWGGFLLDADEFDPLFFNLSGTEAEQMDPQQRLFLQCGWAALEDAGYCGPGVRGASFGVFAGAPASDYPVDNDLGDVYSDVHVLTGNDNAFLASRLSYLLDLHGPSLTLNTACSSSLVAVHLACQAIAAGECETALAGGVCLFVGPGFYLSASNGGMLSPTGRCRTFDRTADGFVPGEGAGLVVLKDYDAAVRDGDTIRGVILGGAVNQDGKTNGITAPSSRSQTAVQQAAYRRAGISADAIDFVEAHGTGTQLGDPIEIEALTRAFAEHTSRRGYCAIGSIKTNLGHTGQAAGIAGLLKVLLSLEHQVIPANLHFETANERIAFQDTPFYVPTVPVAWPRRAERPRVAAVSSFGYSGTNAHLVVQEGPERESAGALSGPGTSSTLSAPRLVPVSAKTREALAERIADLRSWLDGEGAARSLTDIAFTLLVGRAHFTERAAFAVRDVAELRAVLDTWRDSGRLTTGSTMSVREELAAVHQRLAAAGEDPDAALAALAEAAGVYERGGLPDANVLFSGVRASRIPMPTYPFAREKYWNRPMPSESEDGAIPAFSFQPTENDPAVAGHVVLGRPILAAAWSLALAREGVRRAGRSELTRMEDVRWRRPLPVGGNVQVVYQAEGRGVRFSIDLADSAEAQPAVEGVLLPAGPAEALLEPVPDGQVLDRQVLDGQECYRRFREYGFDYGPAFQVLRRVRLGAGRADADLAPVTPAGFEIDPVLLDGALQTLLALGLDEPGAEVGVPYALRGCELHGSLAAARRSRLRTSPDGTADLELTDEDGRALIVLRGLTVANGAGSDQVLRFEPVWVPVPRPGAAVKAAGAMLVVDLTAGRSAMVSGADVAVPGDAFARTGDGRYTLDPQSPEDYRRLLAAVSPATIVLLTGPAREPGDLFAFHAASALCRALMDARLAGPVGVRIGYPGRGDADEPALAALGAFARSVRLENPDLRCQTVALADGPDWEVLSAAASADEPVEIRVVDGAVSARRLRELSEATPSAPASHAGRTYVVTGGTGYLGSLVASRLAGRGAEVVVVGRSARAEDSARIHFERADVADETAMAEALRRIRSRFGAVHGVVHACGVTRDGLLRAKPEADVAEVLRAKVEGALVLDRLTREDPLDFVVYFSSVAAVTGNAGQTDYAYANAFLDALARRRAARGGSGVTLSIGWPAWAGGGMAQEIVLEDGVSALDRAEGLAAFEEALGWGVPHAVVAYGDPVEVRGLLVPQEADHTPEVISDEAVARTREEAVSVLTERLAQELRIPAARIDPDTELEHYGIDSVMVMQLSKRLEPDFGELPKTAFFEHRTLNELAGYLAARSAAAVARRASAVPQPIVEDRAEIAEPSRAVRSAASVAPVERPGSGYDIAVVGIAGRYPMAGDLAGFWRNLKDGRDCVTEIPPDRWPLAGFYDAERGPGRSYSKWGGFLDDVECFDPLFFNISPKESDMLDPQERLFLETAWHALEDAGYSRSSLSGSSVGVFVGVMYGHYELLPMAPDGRMGVSSYASIANRVSYHLDLHGPSIALDTMCSSSLTAVHLACASIAGGECDAALAGGVNVTVHPRKYLQLSLAEFMSSDGRCRSFGAGGDGYVPGEGVGAVLLKPLAKAIEDGDHVRAVIRGSAINHGGKTNGYTVPDPRAQASAIATALRVGGVAAGDIGYIEAHGTGTALGDPIEIAALGRALADVPAGRSIPIGSVKSGVGHLEAAAGIAAITKVILQMEHRTLVPSLHAEEPNPEIDFSGTPFRVQREAAAWQPDSGRLIAGISSFGAGGANAHLVLESLTAPAVPQEPVGDQIIALSAKSPERLAESARRLAAHLDGLVPAGEGLKARPDAAGLDRELLIHVQQLLGVGPDDLGSDDPLEDCGFDAAARSVLEGWLAQRYGLAEQGLPETLTTVARMADWLRGRLVVPADAATGTTGEARGAAPRLADIAFTLQSGREPMPVRLAFVAADLRDAIRVLSAFAAGEQVPEARLGGFGPATEDRPVLDLSDAAGREYLRSLTEQGRLDRVAALWAGGAGIDWKLLHGGRPRRRVPLPGYPFARERHWLPVEPGAEPETGQTHRPVPKASPSVPAEALPASVSDDADTEPWLRELLTEAVAEVIGTAPERIDPKGKFFDYGLESVTMKQLAVRASDQLGFAVSPTLFFDRPSVAEAAAWILEEHPTAVRGAHAAGPGPIAESPGPDSPTHWEGRLSVLESQPTALEPQPTALDDLTPPPGGPEPIAVIGMSARFPGSADRLRYWENLRDCRNLVTEVPADRWDWREQAGVLPPDQQSALRWGGFIDDVDAFDAAFFGITAAEAAMMDPQQRILLQLVWAALEDAGHRPSHLAGRRVGLFAGIQFSDYQHLLHEAGVYDTYAGLGNEHAIALNRISYLLDLRGPSEPVNTACSSSLVAVHRAIRSLREGESEVAVAGGIGLNLAPYSAVADALLGVMSADGATRTLDRDANGFVKGEGAGVLVLKPLNKARSDGDHVYAVLRGSAVNHGGRAASLTAPRAEAQADVIVDAVRDAAVDPGTIGYLEMHGTATELGDPVEVSGIKQAFRRLYRERGAAVPTEPRTGLGSAKTNVGHLEPASGMAGLIKLVLSLGHRTIPGMAHFQALNPYVDLEGGPFFIADRTVPWPEPAGADGRPAPRRGGVSAFGFGGVNAHVVVEESPRPVVREDEAPGDRVFLFSAKTATALDRTVRNFLAWLEDRERGSAAPLRADDVAFTLREGREEFAERLAVVAPSLEVLRERLRSACDSGVYEEPVFRGSPRPGPARTAPSEGEDDPRVLAAAWVGGFGVDQWPAAEGSPARVPLPTYPFALDRFWFQAPTRKQTPVHTARPFAAGLTELVEPAAAVAPVAPVVEAAPSDDSDEYYRILELFSERLRIPEEDIDPDRPFRELGVDSLLSVGITQALQQIYGSRVPFAALADHPTVRRLAAYLGTLVSGGVPAPEPARPRTERPAVVPPPSTRTHRPARPKQRELPDRLPPEIVPLNGVGSKQTSFWVPGADGYAASLANLSVGLGPDYPVYAFQTRGTDGVSMPQRMDDMLDTYLSCIRAVQPHGPYVIGGYSFGGLTAIELARRLHEAGETIKHLVLFDTYPATQKVFDLHKETYDYDFIPFYMANVFLDLEANPQLAIRQEELEHLPRELLLLELAWIAKERGNKRIAVEDIYHFLRGGTVCADHSAGLYQMYKMRYFDASDVLFFKALDGFTGKSSAIYWPPSNIMKDYDYVTPWHEYFGTEMQLVELDNDHLNMLQEPTLSQVVKALLPVLDA